jgi:predicted DNA repair protein MutK
MSVGFLALLDDVAALAKVAAASIDDVADQAAKAGAKAAGVVIDDAAVTPRYVVGFAADRELPIVARSRSDRCATLVILLPVAPSARRRAARAITPPLMIGGAYLAYEGTEKVYEAISPTQRTSTRHTSTRRGHATRARSRQSRRRDQDRFHSLR